MPITTATVVTTAATSVGRSVLQELKDRVRQAMPQGKFEAENKEQFEQLTVENAQQVQVNAHQVQVLATRIVATDQTLAHLTDRVEDSAAVVQELIDYIDWLEAVVYKRSADESPPQADRENVAREAAKAYYYAGSDEKRQIVWEALNSSFNPKFYIEGLQKILWQLVDKLEYPDFRVLQELQDGTIRDMALVNTAEDVFYAERLAAAGLVLKAALADHTRTRYAPAPIALKLLAFARPPARKK